MLLNQTEIVILLKNRGQDSFVERFENIIKINPTRSNRKRF